MRSDHGINNDKLTRLASETDFISKKAELTSFISAITSYRQRSDIKKNQVGLQL